MKHLRFLLLSILLCVAGRAGAGELLYVNDANGLLGTVDVETGVATVIGSTGTTLTDIAFDPTGQLFGISATTLYLIDPQTGAATALGAHGIPDANALVFRTDGTLYAAGAGSTDLYRLDPTTGKSVLLFDLGVQSGGDLAFFDDELYLTTPTNQLVFIDPDFGDSFVLGPLGGGIADQLATGSNGTLFYGVAGTVVSTVDPFSLRSTELFDYAGQGLGAAAGTAFVSETVPAITSALTAAGQIQQPFRYQVAATNDADDFDAAGLPPGLSINEFTGVISGTPTTDGTFSVTLFADNDGGGSGSSTLTLTIAPAARPVITSATTGAAQVGAFFYYKITAANTPTGFGAGTLPAGLTFYPTLGVISGIPRQAGTAAVTFSATNSAGSDTRTLLISTTAPGLPVVTLATNIGRVTAGTGQTGQFVVVRTGVDTSADLRINYVVAGTAVAGTDYVQLKGVKRMKPGLTSVKINVNPLGFGTGPGVKRIVTLTLAPGSGYTVGPNAASKVRIIGQ